MDQIPYIKKLGKKGGQKARRTLLIGAGDAASTLLHEQFKKPSPDMNIICCVDDAPEKQGRYIMGIQIMGTTEDIPEIVEQCEIESILLAIPTIVFSYYGMNVYGLQYPIWWFPTLVSLILMLVAMGVLLKFKMFK